MKFGSSLQSASVKPMTWPPELLDIDAQDLNVVYTVDATPTQAPLAPASIEYREIEKIVYVDKPTEVIKYVDREVIKEIEKPVIVEKVVLVEAAAPPPEIKEVIVEKYIAVEKQIKVKNEINTILIYIIALSLLANVIQGMF